MKPREFERLYRGFLIREELEWDRMRSLMGMVSSALGGNRNAEQIRPLPILDKLRRAFYRPYDFDTDEHNKLRELAKKLNDGKY